MEKKLYRQTTVGYWFCMFVTNSLSRRTYWFCMFVTNSLSRRTVLQINLRQLHSVPLGTQAFQLPQAASKQRSVPWCCRCSIWSMRLHLRQKMYNTQSNAKHLLFQFETENTTPEFDIANKPGTMMPCMTSLPNKGAQTQLWIGNV